MIYVTVPSGATTIVLEDGHAGHGVFQSDAKRDRRWEKNRSRGDVNIYYERNAFQIFQPRFRYIFQFGKVTIYIMPSLLFDRGYFVPGFTLPVDLSSDLFLDFYMKNACLPVLLQCLSITTRSGEVITKEYLWKTPFKHSDRQSPSELEP